jgi:hypothetical protein
VRSRLALAAAVLAAVAATQGAAAATAPPPPAPPIHHVFIIVLENESNATTFGAGSPAPYLAQTLRAQGAYLPDYFATGHLSNDNYVAMISGQAPNLQNQTDCQVYDNLAPSTIGQHGQAQGTGCIYPTAVKTIADQLDAAGLTWRDYNDGMGADPAREASECGHPGVGMIDNTQKATALDQYATRHNPFVYFHSIIDDTTLCDANVVNLDLLPHDLASVANTANYTFITPDLCNDGHDPKCANGGPGGLAQADAFLRAWVPRITGSGAFKRDNGLLIVTFDESSNTDTSSCCGEIAGPGSPLPGLIGVGGGDVGAVMLSPCIAPGTVSLTSYNHYTMLRSVEGIFGLSQLGYAGLAGGQPFGSDVYTRAGACSAVPVVRLRAPRRVTSRSRPPRVTLRWSATGAPALSFALQVRQTGAGSHRWRTLVNATTRRSLRFSGRDGASYQFQVRATGAAGLSRWATAAVVFARRP